jgi:hypothetical protein
MLVSTLSTQRSWQACTADMFREVRSQLRDHCAMTATMTDGVHLRGKGRLGVGQLAGRNTGVWRRQHG